MNLPTADNPPAAWRKLFVWYAALSFLLILPSALLWFSSPLDVLRHNFDVFCGILQIPGWSAGAINILSRSIQAVVLLVLGILFYRLATRHSDAIESSSWRQLAPAIGLLLAIFFAGLPWMNPDMFFYVGRGWVEGGYELDPYKYPIVALKNFRADEMFRNIDPPLLRSVGNYGPLHQSLCASMTALSGGSIKVAVVLFKLLHLGLLLLSAWIVYRLARQQGLKAKHLVFCYLCNPIVPLVLLAWVHNDIQQNVLVLLCVLCVFSGRPFLAGASLGGAIALKYAAIVLLPGLILYWWRSHRQPWRAAAICTAGAAAVVGFAFLPYPNAISIGVGTYNIGWSPIRSSIYTVLFPIAHALGISVPVSLRQWLALAYFVCGAAITFRMMLRKDVAPIDFAKLSVWIFNLYFLICAPAVLEWYLTWALTSLLLLRGHFRSFAVLFSFYMPLVPFTLYLPDSVAFPVSIALYLLFVVCTVKWTSWREDFGGALFGGRRIAAPLQPAGEPAR